MSTRQTGMTSIVLLMIALCAPGLTTATSVAPKPLEEMVQEANHVVVATVVRVDMVDHAGWAVLEPEANTGPGLRNRLRFHLAVEECCSRATRRCRRG